MIIRDYLRFLIGLAFVAFLAVLLQIQTRKDERRWKMIVGLAPDSL